MFGRFSLDVNLGLCNYRDMNGFKVYESTDQVNVGDVVVMKSDTTSSNPGYNAFRTCVVEKIKDDKVFLARPHVLVQAPFQMAVHGTAFVAMEHFDVCLDRFVDAFVAFTNGPSGDVDNRCR